MKKRFCLFFLLSAVLFVLSSCSFFIKSTTERAVSGTGGLPKMENMPDGWY